MLSQYYQQQTTNFKRTEILGRIGNNEQWNEVLTLMSRLVKNFILQNANCIKILVIIMDRKVSHLKSSISNLKFSKQSKRKTTKNSSARTPKHLESIFDQKSIHLSKFKTVHSKPQREGIRSVLPPCSNLFNEIQPQHLKKVYKTNQTEADIPHCQSEKTITLVKTDCKPKENNKSQKTSKKNQSKKVDKNQFESCKQFLTTRKSSVKKTDLKNLLLRTEKALEGYQKREQQWLKERQTLVEQVQQMRRKQSNKKCITHSSSAYISKKPLF